MFTDGFGDRDDGQRDSCDDDQRRNGRDGDRERRDEFERHEDRERYDALERRLDAVERAVTDGASGNDDAITRDRIDPTVAEPDRSTITESDRSTLAERVDELETRVDEVEERIDELDAAMQAVRGYVGGIRAVNRDVERRADLALAKVEAMTDGTAVDAELRAAVADAEAEESEVYEGGDGDEARDGEETDNSEETCDGRSEASTASDEGSGSSLADRLRAVL